MSDTNPANARAVYETIKAATVAIALMHPPEPGSKNRPFSILGSGFCIHPEGIVVTCRHVQEAFVDPEGYKQILADVAAKEGQLRELKGAVPNVIFYHPKPIGHELYAFPVPVDLAVTKTDFDLAALRIPKHVAFHHGYPTLGIADYDELHETMDIATRLSTRPYA